jgi:minor extracellular protease Epr
MENSKLKLTSLGFWLALVAITFVHLDVGQTFWSGMGTAYAQDDGGDDDDDDGGDDDAGNDDAGNNDGGEVVDENDDSGEDTELGTSDGDDDQVAPANGSGERTRDSPEGANPTTPRRDRVIESAPPPLFAPGEIVVTDLSDKDLAALQADGFTVIERIELVDVAVVLHRLRVPDGLTLVEARDRVRARPTGATGDFNHYFRTEGETSVQAPDPVATPLSIGPVATCAHLNCAVLNLIGWPAARDASPVCQVTVPVGVIDTGVNAAHENLVGADIEVLRLVAEEVEASRAVHGTSVAALLVGQKPDRAPGLIPEANLVVVDVFGRDGGDERASVASLVKALDLLAMRGVRVINMSLVGPPNVALEATLARLNSPGGAVVLAAAGNGGPGAEVAYPAGYPSVLAITAVDSRGQVYRRAQRGAHVDLAAPGVEVWSATSISGVKPKTGTSFAVPFATAVAAILVSRDPDATPEAIATRLRGLVRDVGSAGPDEVFGAGLLQLDTLCVPELDFAALE